MHVEWMMALAIAVGVVGLIQWVKGLLKTVPTWIWAVISVVACVIFAFLIGATEAPAISIGEMIILALLAIAISQLGYEVIVQGIPALVQGLLNIISGTPGIAGPQGKQGAPGVSGVQGAAGIAGVQGSAGAAGAQGPTGPTGAQGPVGAASVVTPVVTPVVPPA
jgi:hypothetical protein